MPITLTELQSSRIDFHLDLDSNRSLLTISKNIREKTFDQPTLLALVGDLTTASPSEIIEFGGVQLCTAESTLGRCEVSLKATGPATINNTLFVKQAGKVTLRGDELKARKQLYKAMVAELKQLVGYSSFDEGRATLDL